MNPLGAGDPLRLGPYRLIGVLGAGGMGKVYFGRDSKGSPAAIKVLRPEVAHDADMSRRFVREAQAARAVQSSGVARVLDAQTEGGRPWIATEFLAGPTLDDAIERYGPMENATVRCLGADVARTLCDVHAAGLVHRDLKPANIVLTSSGPRIIDFGIARPEHGLTLTSTGQIPVTPGYGAPEQVLGQRVGPAGDVFSLGSVLAFAASGQRAYAGGHIAAVQYEVVHGEANLENVPYDLRTLIAPCLAKDPAYRPRTEQVAEAMAPPRKAERAWREGSLGQDIAARETHAKRLVSFPGDEGQAPRFSRRRVLSLVGAGGAAAAMAGAGAWWWLDSGVPSDEWRAKPVSIPDSQGSPPRSLWGPITSAADPKSPPPLPIYDVVVVGAPGGGLRAYGVTDGKTRWSSPGLAHAARYFASTDEVLVAADGKGALHGLDVQDQGKKVWTARDADVSLLLAADDQSAYFFTRRGRLRALDIDSLEPRWTVPSPVSTSEKAPVLADAGSGKLVLSGADGSVAAVDTATGKLAWPVRKRQSSKPLQPCIHEGAVYLGGKSLTAVSLSNGKVKWSHPSDASGKSEGWTAPAILDGALYAADGVELRRRSLADGSQKWTYQLPGEAPPSDPPAVQGHSIWIPLDQTGANGVTTVRTDNGLNAWTYGAGPEAKLTMAAADNRVFILRGGELTAMPVF
ncbi:serine/threonine-protein kinase [Streptomyces sp. ODS28]|uniref:serine/threonine-protein kinase n=1 Tax=Streptomyces sp. ODS28 TaxID=3136688 RepID=UPI0031EE0586